MSTSCSCSLPGALPMTVTARPQPATPTISPLSLLLDCLSIFLPPPVDPHPLLYTTDQHTSVSEHSSPLSSGCHTAALTHSVYHSRWCDTRKRMTTSLCVSVRVCTLPFFSRRTHYPGDLFKRSWIPHLRSQSSPQPGRSEPELSSLRSLFKNKSSCLPLYLSKIGATSAVTGPTLAKLNWTHSVPLVWLWQEGRSCERREMYFRVV